MNATEDNFVVCSEDNFVVCSDNNFVVRSEDNFAKSTSSCDPVHTVPDSRSHDIKFGLFMIIFTAVIVSMKFCFKII